jgi:hypothetical protein
MISSAADARLDFHSQVAKSWLVLLRHDLFRLAETIQENIWHHY